MKQKPCEYCDEEPKPIIQNDCLKLVLDEDGDIVVSISFGSGPSVRIYKTIKYCPMCGRRLEVKE